MTALIAKRRAAPTLPALLLLAFLLTLWVQWPRLINPYAVEEDFRRHHWLDGFQAAELFEQDPAVGSFVFKVATPVGTLVLDRRSPLYGLIFQIGGRFLPIILISKLLTFPLILAAVYYAFRIGERHRGLGTGVALALALIVLNLAANTMTSTLGGLQRSFTMPLCLGLIYYLMTQQDRAAAIVLVISGLIYAPIFFVGSLAYGFCLVTRTKTGFALQWRRAVPLIGAVLVVGLLLAPLLFGRSETSAPVAGNRLAFLDDPLLQENGRHSLFTIFPVVGHGGLMLNGVDIIHMLFLFAFLVFFWFVDRTTIADLPRPLTLFFWATLVGFAAAWLTPLLFGSFLLYFPSRYTQTPLLLFGFLAVMLNAGTVLETLAGRLAQQRGQLHKIVLPIALLGFAVLYLAPAESTGPRVGSGNSRYLLWALNGLLLFLAAILWRRRGAKPAAVVAQTWGGSRIGIMLGLPLFLLGLVYADYVKWPFYTASSSEIALFDFLETLPDDIRLAGAPLILDSVPMFAQRQVLFSHEQIHPDMAVMFAFVEAYYAGAPGILADFCQAYDIDYFVVNERDFSESVLQGGSYLFEPLDSYLQPRLQSPLNLVLRDLPPELKLFQSGSIYVVDCAVFPTLAVAN